MKIHRREELVNKAEVEFNEFVINWYTKHKLTYVEIYQIFVNRIQQFLRYNLRQERHPEDPNKPAGLE